MDALKERYYAALQNEMILTGFAVGNEGGSQALASASHYLYKAEKDMVAGNWLFLESDVIMAEHELKTAATLIFTA